MVAVVGGAKVWSDVLMRLFVGLILTFQEEMLIYIHRRPYTFPPIGTKCLGGRGLELMSLDLPLERLVTDELYGVFLTNRWS